MFNLVELLTTAQAVVINGQAVVINGQAVVINGQAVVIKCDRVAQIFTMSLTETAIAWLE